MKRSEKIIMSTLESIGITINGNRPCDIQVHNNQLYDRIICDGSLGMGESYMDGWWDCEQLDELANRIAKTNFQDRLVRSNILALIFEKLKMTVSFSSRRYSQKNSLENVKFHYDIGNYLYTAMLDKELNYSCGYWKNTQNLDEAQQHKLKLICEKLGLKAGQKVLDIGCGWGSFARYAAKNYGVSVVGVTLSKEQLQLAQKLNQGLPIDIQLKDYRDVKDQFDRIVSIGMFEHVGYKQYKQYMKTAHRCLKDNGLFLLHTIGNTKTIHKANPWIDKYIFPNGICPSMQQISRACEDFFVIEDVHNFGSDYDKTLMAWHKNFNHHWETLKKNSQYDQRFFRMWNFYLLSCAGMFRARDLHLFQLVLSKGGVADGYHGIR